MASASKLDVHETANYIRSFDLALLTETWCEDSEVFKGYSKFGLPLADPGKAGEGTCVLVHPRLQGSVSLWKLQPAVQAVWVRVNAAVFGLDRDVFIACVYIPPAGSNQLHSQSLSARMASLRSAVISAQEHGHVILGGDFNAKVETMDDLLLPDRQFLEDSSVACQRGCSHASSNLHGQLLIDLCLAASVLLATGPILGDASAPATFFRGGSDSRLDHFVMSRVVLPATLACEVATHRFHSDHKPLTLTFPPPASSSAEASTPLPSTASTPLPNLQWDGAKQAKYVQHMKDRRAALADCHSKVDANKLDSAFHQLGSIMVEVASEAGCQTSSGARTSKGNKGKPVLPDDSLHLHILRDNIADAKGLLPSANWARGIEVKFAALGMASLFVSSGIGALDSHGFMDRLAGARQRTWDGLHVSPRAAPSKGAKLCTYHHWFGRPNKVHREPYYELPMSITRLRALVQFRLGSHSLPVESKAGLLDPASPAISVGATFATLRLLAMSFITFLTALALVPSGLSIPICFRMLRAPCVCSCGMRTKRLLAIASQPFCKWPRHEYRSVLISQALGFRMDVVQFLSLS